MTTLTFDKLGKVLETSFGNGLRDCRGVIYAGAFRKPFTDGRLTMDEISACLTEVKSRPQLHSINGRPC